MKRNASIGEFYLLSFIILGIIITLCSCTKSPDSEYPTHMYQVLSLEKMEYHILSTGHIFKSGERLEINPGYPTPDKCELDSTPYAMYGVVTKVIK